MMSKCYFEDVYSEGGEINAFENMEGTKVLHTWNKHDDMNMLNKKNSTM